MGCDEWKAQIPKVQQPIHIIFMIMGIFPGWTALAVCLSACVNEGSQFNQCQLIMGIVIWLCHCIFLIGWIWGIYWNWLMFQKSK